MTSKILMVVFLIPAVLLGMLITADYAVVDIQDEGTRIVVPVPVFLASLALRFAPAGAQYVEVPEIARYVPVARKAVTALQDARDAVLVAVEEGDESVRVEKVGDDLEIDVIERGEEVRVRIPLRAVTTVLDGYDGRGFRTRAFLDVIGEIGHGDVVHVRERDEEVRVWIW